MDHPINYYGATGQTLTAKIHDTTGLVASVALTEGPNKRYYVSNANLVAAPLAAGEYSFSIENASGTVVGVGGGLLLWDGAQERIPLDLSAYGTVNDASPTTTDFDTTGTPRADVADYEGQVIVFIDGALAGFATKVQSASNGVNMVVSPALPVAPANGARFRIIGRITT